MLIQRRLIPITLVVLAACGSAEDTTVREVHQTKREERAREVAVEQRVRGRNGMRPVDASAAGPRTFPAAQWSIVVNPAKLGWSTARLDGAKELYESLNYAGAMIVQDGVVVAEWGETARPMNIRSMRKALLGSLYGRLVASGAIRLDATLADLGIDDAKQPLTAEEKRARVSDILSASSGITLPAAYDADSKPPRGTVRRGTFVYNNWDFNVANTIYERAARRSIFDAFVAEIAQPIGMQDLERKHMTYRREDVSEHPAYLFEMSARDLARFGLLYVRGGVWNERQLIPREWVADSTTAKVTTTRRNESYGYLWWVRSADAEWGRGAFSITGNGGQIVWVDPGRKLVIVLMSDTSALWLKRALRMQVTNDERSEMLRRILAAAP